MRKPAPSKKSLLDRVRSSGANKVKVAITDIDGVLRGKYLHLDKFESASETGFGFCNVVLGWDAADVCYDNAQYTGWHTGYPDVQVRLDADTYRQVPWDGNVPFVLGDFVDRDENPLVICPRQLLKRVLARLERAGYSAMSSFEYEFFHFRETPQSFADKHHVAPAPLTPGMFGYSLLRLNQNRGYVNALFDELGAFGVPIEGLHTETGPDRKSTRLNSSHLVISYAVFCLK